MSKRPVTEAREELHVEQLLNQEIRNCLFLGHTLLSASNRPANVLSRGMSASPAMIFVIRVRSLVGIGEIELKLHLSGPVPAELMLDTTVNVETELGIAVVIVVGCAIVVPGEEVQAESAARVGNPWAFEEMIIYSRAEDQITYAPIVLEVVAVTIIIVIVAARTPETDRAVPVELTNKFAEFHGHSEFNRSVERPLRINEAQSRTDSLEPDVAACGGVCAAYRKQQAGSDEDHSHGRSCVHVLFPYLR